jgi:hypothetical protein
VFDFWLKNGALEFPSREYLAFLDRHCFPERSFEIRQAGSVLTLDAAVPPFGFVFFEVKRVPD